VGKELGKSRNTRRNPLARVWWGKVTKLGYQIDFRVSISARDHDRGRRRRIAHKLVTAGSKVVLRFFLQPMHWNAAFILPDPHFSSFAQARKGNSGVTFRVPRTMRIVAILWYEIND